MIAIGLFDLLGAAKAVIVDAKCVGYGVEVYLFTALVYFAFCYGVSQYSRTLTKFQKPCKRKGRHDASRRHAIRQQVVR